MNPPPPPQGERLFEWVDGPLINAIKDGDMVLLDEISLADDSVLERLNRSVDIPLVGALYYYCFPIIFILGTF